MLAHITDQGHDALRCYRRDQKVEDLEHSVRHFDHALEICPHNHHCRASVLFNLATARLIMCQANGSHTPDSDFDAPITLYRAALDMRGIRRPDWPTTSLYFALALVSRSSKGGNQGDANEALELLMQIRDLCAPDSYQHRYVDLFLRMCAETKIIVNQANTTVTKPGSAMMKLGAAFWEHWSRSLDPLGLKSKIVGMSMRAATSARECWNWLVHPTDPTDEMIQFATALSARYHQFGNITDLNLCIRAMRNVVQGTPKDHPERFNRLACFSEASFDRFKQLGNIWDLEEAISSGEEATQAAPHHPDLSMILSHLNTTFHERFARFGIIADLHKAISIGEEALHLAPHSHPKLHIMHSRLSDALRYRFERLGNTSDLERAISECEAAEQLISPDHPEMHVVLNNLSIAFFARFQRYGDTTDLDKAISRCEEAIRLAPYSVPTCLSNLAISLFNRFDRVGNIADIDKAVSVGEEAVQLTAPGHPDMPDWLNNLGAALLRRFTRLDDTADVDKAILVIEEAVKSTPSGHPDLYGRLHSLGVACIKRYGKINDIADLERAISASERGLQVTPDDHPDRYRMFELLGIALYSRFQRFKDVADLDKSISLGEGGINCSPRGHPSFPYLLWDQSIRFVARFIEFGNIVDIDKGISLGAEAARIIPVDHPNVSVVLGNLGLAFLERFERLGHRSDLLSAVAHFSGAACSVVCPPSMRFQASLHWISCARKLGDGTLLDAYSCTINLLPQIAWIGLPLKDRYRGLLLAADVVRDAAATALEFGHTEIAVEWLEQGRSVVWAQHFQLRTPLDALRSVYPNLADHLERVSSELEHASASHDQFTFQRIGESSLEQHTQRHHALALEQERLLEQIRSMPSFERFLLPKLFSQLRASAHSGTVVLLNASEQRCDALIITTNSVTVLHVPLPDMSYKHAEYLRSSLDASRIHHGRGSERAARPIRLHGMDFILAELWRNVVKPVLSALNFPVCTLTMVNVHLYVTDPEWSDPHVWKTTTNFLVPYRSPSIPPNTRCRRL